MKCGLTSQNNMITFLDAFWSQLSNPMHVAGHNNPQIFPLYFFWLLCVTDVIESTLSWIESLKYTYFPTIYLWNPYFLGKIHFFPEILWHCCQHAWNLETGKLKNWKYLWKVFLTTNSNRMWILWQLHRLLRSEPVNTLNLPRLPKESFERPIPKVRDSHKESSID